MNDSTTKFTVIPERWQQVQALPLKRGSHEPGSENMCVMEAVAYVAGERWSDRPVCACPVISSFLRSWNDALPDDTTRDRLLKPLIPRLVGSRAKHAAEQRRAFLAFDWMLRTFTPGWLERVPALAVYAQELRTIDEITDSVGARTAMPTLEAALEASAAREEVWASALPVAREAAWIGAADAAKAAAREAAWAAVRLSAWWDTVWTGTVEPAWADAWEDAWDAGWAAITTVAIAGALAAVRELGSAESALSVSASTAHGGEAIWEATYGGAVKHLAPTVEWCQESAVRLIERMLAVGEHT